jgi:hypothetical protein
MVPAVASRNQRTNRASSSDNDAAQPPSFSVGRDGKIDGINFSRPRDQRRGWTAADHARFELAERQEPAPAEPPAPPRRAQTSSGKKIFAVAIIAAGLLIPVAGYFGLRLWNDYKARSAKASGLIVIDSVPPNGLLFINGVEVGHTPYVELNKFRRGSMVPVRIIYPGAQEWSGTFPGGVDTTLTAELQAK